MVTPTCLVLWKSKIMSAGRIAWASSALKGSMENLHRISYSSLIGRLLRFPLHLIPHEAQVPILWGKCKGQKWIVGSSNHGCWIGSYELEKRLLFERIVQVNDIVYDIGAHVGFYTLLAAKLVYKYGRVFAFEPHPRNVLYLKEHLRINNISNVEIVARVVADIDGETYFDIESGSFQGHIVREGTTCLPKIGLDSHVFSHGIPLPNCIKIDVEGSELLVLTGAREILTSARPYLFVATHGRKVHQQCCDFLSAIGYQLLPITGNSLDKTDEIFAFFS